MAGTNANHTPAPYDDDARDLADAEPESTAPGTDHVPDEVKTRFWAAVKRMPSYIRLAANLAKDPDVPNAAKGVLAVGGGYAVSPIDLVPGIIPVAGQLDDVYVMLTALSRALKMTPTDVADRHLATAGLHQDDIETDLQAVRDLVRVAFRKSVAFGGKALGRISRAAFNFANTQRKRWQGDRPAGPSEP